MSKKVLPEIIKKVGFDFDWDEEKAWALELPVEKMDISKLEWHFDTPFWWTKGGFYDFEPRKAIDNPSRYPRRIARIMKSDLKYPLDIMHWRGRWLLLDGLHRLVKAKMIGMEEVDVRRVPQEAIPKIQK